MEALSTVPVVDFRRIWPVEKDFLVLIFGATIVVCGGTNAAPPFC
jgi:hypothetical protein